MSVIRVKKDKNFFAASNEPFNDERLSWEARGVMGYLLSKPDDWQVRFADLVKRGPAGDHKIRRILKELETAGYLKRKRYQTEGGTFDWVSVVYENCTISQESLDGDTIYGLSIDGEATGGDTISQLSTRGKTTRGLSTRGKPRDIVSTELTNTELINTEGNGRSAAAIDPVLILSQSSGLSYFPADQLEWMEVIKRMAEDHGVEKTIAVMKKACQTWTATRGKNGRSYRATNLSWINWAQDELLGGQAAVDPSKMTDKEYLEWTAQQYGGQNE